MRGMIVRLRLFWLVTELRWYAFLDKLAYRLTGWVDLASTLVAVLTFNRLSLRPLVDRANRWYEDLPEPDDLFPEVFELIRLTGDDADNPEEVPDEG